MRPSEALAAIAGIALLAMAIFQAAHQRAYEPFLIGGIALVVVAAIGQRMTKLAMTASGFTVEAAEVRTDHVVQASASAERDVKLTIGHIYPMGVAETLMGADHAVQIDIVNVGTRPVGVQSLGLRMTNRQWTPFLNASPYADSKKIPGILEPEQRASVYHNYAGLVAMLKEDGLALQEVVAQLADGTERTLPIPADFISASD